MNWTVDRRCYPLGPLMMGQGILAKAAEEEWCSSATVLVEAKNLWCYLSEIKYS